MNDQEKFEFVFKKRGGLFDMSDEAPDHFLFDYIEHFKWKIDRLQVLHPEYPTPIFGFINNESFNAAATIYNGDSFIGINIGTVAILRDTFNRMLSCKNVFPEYGGSEDSEEIKLYNAHITKFSQLYNQSPAPTPYPEDPLKQTLASLLLHFALGYLFMHEYAHIIDGHVDYKKNLKKSLTSTFTETNFASVSGVLDPMVSQTLEMDADSLAAWEGIENILYFSNNMESLERYLWPFYADPSVTAGLWAFAIHTTLRLFGNNIPKVEDLPNLSHPPSGLRQWMNLGTISTNLMRILAKETLDNFVSKIVGYSFQSEKAFQEISQNPVNISAFAFAATPECQNHMQLYFKEWKTLRPELIKYSIRKSLSPIENN